VADFLGVNRAVPSKSLLNRDDPAMLGFDTTSWDHLNRYVAAVEQLPAEYGCPDAMAGALAKLRSVAEEFSSPKQLRALMEDRRELLTAGPPPKTLYASIAWLAAHLHQSASSIAEILQRSVGPSLSPGDARKALQELGSAAESARKTIGPLLDSLRHFKPAILDANAALAAAYTSEAETLQRVQEDTGRLTVKAETVQRDMARLGFFHAGRKSALDRELTALHQQQDATSSRSEKLRAALAAIEPIQNEGFWLGSGVDDLIGFLDSLRQVLTAFGSAVTQIATDASDAQLQDAGIMKTVLGKEAAISEWSAVAKAAEAFLGRMMPDVPAPNLPAGAQR
jgi:hypothetical protein